MLPDPQTPVSKRAAAVIDLGEYLSLGTTGPDRRAWVSEMHYVAFVDPLRLVFGSSLTSHHATNMVTTPAVSGAISLRPRSHGMLDGVQLTGTCEEVPSPEVADVSRSFYTALGLETERDSKAVKTAEELTGAGEHRLFRLIIERLWILDVVRWTESGTSDRTPVGLDATARYLRWKDHVGGTAGPPPSP